MGIISVIVRTYDGVDTCGVWDDLASTQQYAIETALESLTSRDRLRLERQHRLLTRERNEAAQELERLEGLVP